VPPSLLRGHIARTSVTLSTRASGWMRHRKSDVDFDAPFGEEFLKIPN
jgi:hypothetical protein